MTTAAAEPASVADVATADVTAPAARPSTLLPAARHHRARAKPGSILASRAATEYVYVGQDLRRVVIVSVIVFGTMLVLWLLLVVMGISPLY